MRRAPHRLDLFVLGALLLAQHASAQAPSTAAPPADAPSTAAPPAAPPVDAPSIAPTSFPAPLQRAKADEKPPLGVLPTPDDLLMDPRMARSWGALPARLFVATTFDIGFVYLRPRVSFGYGRPFTSWFGVDVNALALSAGLGAYAVTKAALDKLVEAWRSEHPNVGFTRVVVGDCAGGPGNSMTEFARSWDGQLAGEMLPLWSQRNLLSGALLDVEELVKVVDTVLRCGATASIPSVTLTPRRPS